MGLRRSGKTYRVETLVSDRNFFKEVGSILSILYHGQMS